MDEWTGVVAALKPYASSLTYRARRQESLVSSLLSLDNATATWNVSQLVIFICLLENVSTSSLVYLDSYLQSLNLDTTAVYFGKHSSALH